MRPAIRTIALLALLILLAAAPASAHGDDVTVAHEGEDHPGDSNADAGDNPLPGFAPAASLAALLAVAMVLRRR